MKYKDKHVLNQSAKIIFIKMEKGIWDILSIMQKFKKRLKF